MKNEYTFFKFGNFSNTHNSQRARKMRNKCDVREHFWEIDIFLRAARIWRRRNITSCLREKLFIEKKITMNNEDVTTSEVELVPREQVPQIILRRINCRMIERAVVEGCSRQEAEKRHNVGLSKPRIPRNARNRAPGDSGKRRQDISRRKFRYTLFAGPSAARGAQPETVNQAPRVNSRRWQTMRGVTKALSSLRPAGCSLPANIQSSVHSPLWNGKRARAREREREGEREEEGRGRRREGAPSITWEIALALFMCVYTDTSRAH